jgi:hypothetical protein
LEDRVVETKGGLSGAAGIDTQANDEQHLPQLAFCLFLGHGWVSFAVKCEKAGDGWRDEKQSAAGQTRCQLRQTLISVAQEPKPIVVQLLPHLADPSGRHLEALAQVQGALVPHHAADHSPLARGQGLEPGGEVDAELDLVEHWGDGVVVQPFFQGIL